MKNIILITIFFLFSFTSFAQYLGSEIKCEAVSGINFMLTVDMYHDAALGQVEDSAFLYINNEYYWSNRRALGKQSQTLLYDSVYHVRYQQTHEISSFFSLVQQPPYRLGLKQNIDSTIVNINSSQIRQGIVWFDGNSDFVTPSFNHSQFSFYNANGFIKHDVSCLATNSLDSFAYFLYAPDTNYFYPSGIFVDSLTGVISIDTALSGSYFLAIGVDYYKGINKNLEGHHSRFMVIDMDKLKTQLATNTKSIQLPKFTLNLYPNPTSETLHITTKTPVDEIQIYNSIGQQVWQGQGFRENQVRVNVRDFSGGMYIVRVRQGDFWVSEQVLVR